LIYSSFIKTLILGSPAVSATRTMSTRFLLFALLALAIHSSLSVETGAPQRRIVFVRDSNIWMANLDGSKERKLIRGADPCISPDGQKVAFTISPAEGKEVARHIAVLELSNGSTKVFKETPSNNFSVRSGRPTALRSFSKSLWRIIGGSVCSKVTEVNSASLKRRLGNRDGGRSGREIDLLPGS
jgi:Tol biopolymer transport system component